VRFEEPAPAEVDGAAERHRQIRVDLRRLDRLMKQIGELVVAKNRLGVLAAGADDPALAEVSDRIARWCRGCRRGDRLPDDARRRGLRALSPAGARPGARISGSASGSTWRARRSSWTARSSTRSATRCCT